MGQIINNIIISLVLSPVVYYLAKKRKGNEWIWVGVTFLISSFIGFWVSLIPIVYLFFCENKEIKILREQAKQGDTDAQYNLGVFLMSKNSYEEAKNWFNRAAEQGHIDAQSKLDDCEKKIAAQKADEERKAADKAAQEEFKRQQIIETIPHYHIYERVVLALEQNGYKVENNAFKKGAVLSFVKRDSINYGLLFAVGKNDIKSMKDAVELVNNSRNRSAVYWPEHSLVGGFTEGNSMYSYNEEWLRILQSVIG